MRSTQPLFFDYLLLASIVMLLWAGTHEYFVVRRTKRSNGWWAVGAAALGVVALLAVFANDILDAITFANERTYPEYSKLVLLIGLLGVIGVMLAAYDSVSQRIGQFSRRFLPDSVSSISQPTLFVMLTVVLTGALLVVRPEDPPAAVIEAFPPRPTHIDLVPTANHDTTTTREAPGLTLTAITERGSLQLPTYLTSDASDDHLFILERLGRVRVFEAGALRAEPVIDVSADVRPGDDGGLIGIALHPDYLNNGRVFIHYTNLDDDNHVVEYRLDPATATVVGEDPQTILRVEQPSSFHAGGMLQFGPDGLLYVAIGEGSTYGTGDAALVRDPDRHAQNPDTMLGTIMRIDVDGETPYSIPPINAFGDRPATETFAFGVRNPYRFWIDAPSDTMLFADVGQVTWEEINALPLDQPGLNFGWDVTEGTSCYLLNNEFMQGCDRAGLTDPILQYRNARANRPGQTGGGCAVIGGPVYRGPSAPDLVGTYLFTDYCGSWIGGLRYTDGEMTDSVIWNPTADLTLGTPLSFGVDGAGEAYLLTSAEGMIYRISQG